MAQVVGSHQQAAFTTPVVNDPLDPAVVVANDNASRTTSNAHDADSGVHLQSSDAASRPAFGTVGRKWFTSDTLRLSFDTGAGWSEAAYLPLAGGTLTGALTVSSGGLTITGNGSISGVLTVPTISGLTSLSVAGAVTVTTAKTTLAVPAAGYASLNLPPGSAPTTLANGDLWTTSSGVQARINGATVTLATTASALSGSGTANRITKWSGTTALTNSSMVDDGVSVAVTGALSTTEEVITPPSSATRPSLYLPHGTAPTSPTNGAVWTTTAGLFVRINGSTIGPLGTPGAGTITGTGTNGKITKWTGTTSVGDSIISESGSTITISGALTLTGKLTTVATAAGAAGFNLPHGTAPTSPVDGDVWTTTSGLLARINGATSGPFNAFTLFSDDGTNPKFGATLLPTTTNTYDIGSAAKEVKRLYLSTNGLFVNNVKVVGTQQTGWTTPDPTWTRTGFDPATVTLAVLAQHVGALIKDLTAHGLLGA